MANYTCATRTNYFRVNDAESFKAFMARAYGTEDRVDLWEEKDKDGNTVYGFGTLGSIAGLRAVSDEDEEDDCDYDAFVDGIQKFVADGDAIIILESGHEKLRYVAGGALVITKDQCEYLDISDEAKKLAAKLLGNPEWATKCEY